MYEALRTQVRALEVENIGRVQVTVRRPGAEKSYRFEHNGRVFATFDEARDCVVAGLRETIEALEKRLERERQYLTAAERSTLENFEVPF